MTQPNAIPSTISTSPSTPNSKPLLLLNDEQRRRRQEALRQKLPSSPNLHHKSRKKSYIKNHEVVEDNVECIAIGGTPPGTAVVNGNHYKQKSKSQQLYATQSQKLLHPHNKQRIHSKSGPPRYKKKKRTFKLSEPTDSINAKEKKKRAAAHLHKKPSRVFIHECAESPNLQRANSYSPSPHSPSAPRTPSVDDDDDDITHITSPPPSLSPSLSAPLYPHHNNSSSSSSRSPSSSSSQHRSHHSSSSSPPRKHRKQQNSFKLGDDTVLPFKFTAASSFSSYKTKYNVHKPRIKPGSNQLLLSAKMKELQAKLKKEDAEIKDVEQDFGKSLDVLQSIKLPNYSGKIPLVLIELKKRLHSVDGLKQKKIFHISFKNHTTITHKIAHLIRRFFIKLPTKLLDNVSIAYFHQISHFKQIPDVLRKIPDPNKSILLWLWDLLSDTIEYQHENKMNPHSLSQSMAPVTVTNNHHYQIAIEFFKLGIQWRLFWRENGNK